MKELILGLNFGGLGTLIASMANLISYKIYAREEDSDTGKYIMVFSEAPKMLIKTFVFRTGQWKIVLKGLKDGLLGRSGKRMSP